MLIELGAGAFENRPWWNPLFSREMGRDVVMASLDKEVVNAWRYPAIAALELMRATYIRQRFTRHAHERFAVGIIEAGALACQIRALHQALEQGVASRLEMQSRFMAMLVVLIQRHSDDRPAQRPIGREPRAVRRTRESIHTHYADDMSMDQLASIACLSPYHFVRVFTRNVGLPPHAYLIQTRVRQARAMLQAGQRPIAAAQAAGFFDQSHFTRHFKRFTGMTPGKYRRIVQENP